MSAIGFYITTCRYVIQCNPHDPESWSDLERYLPFLRQSLSCCVCAQIIHNPMGPPHTVCQHSVCKDCLGGKMRLKPSCSWCKNHEDFVENSQLAILVQCFKKLCEYMASSAIAVALSNANNGGTNALTAIIHEGLAIKDESIPAAGPCIGLFPPKLHKVQPGSEPKRRRRRRKRHSMKVRLGQGHGQCVKGSTQFEDGPSVSRQNDTHDAVNSVKGADLPTATAVSEGHSEGKSEHTPTTESVKDTEDNENNNSENLFSQEDMSPCTVTTELSMPDTAMTPASHQASRDLYNTVAAEHDYVNKDILKDEENKLEKFEKLGKSISNKSRKSENCHINLIKKAKMANFDKLRFEETNMQSIGMDDKDSITFQSDIKQSKSLKKGKGCRCGLATPNPGKLTCCGQRCPCYSAFKGCVDCRCRGCRNPRGDPAKIPQIIQPFIRDRERDESDIEVDIKID